MKSHKIWGYLEANLTVLEMIFPPKIGLTFGIIKLKAFVLCCLIYKGNSKYILSKIVLLEFNATAEYCHNIENHTDDALYDDIEKEVIIVTFIFLILIVEGDFVCTFFKQIVRIKPRINGPFEKKYSKLTA